MLAEVLTSYIEFQVTKVKFNPRELRISENGGCPRKRVLRATGAEKTHPMTIADARNFEKGRMGEGWITSVLETLMPGKVEAEVIVKHPYGDPHGEGHADLVCWETGMVYEVKTVSQEKAAYGLPVLEHVNQNMLYQHFLKAAGHKIYGGEIIYLILARYGIYPRSYPVIYVPDIAAELEEEMRNLWHNHVLPGSVPFVPENAHPKGFPCLWESTELDGTKIQHPCEFHGHCWGLEDSFIDDFHLSLDDPEVLQLFAEYDRLRAVQSSLDGELKRLKGARGPLEEKLAQLFESRPGEKKLTAGSVTIARSQVNGRVSYDISKAAACGAVSLTALEPFKSSSPPYDKYTVSKAKT